MLSLLYALQSTWRYLPHFANLHPEKTLISLHISIKSCPTASFLHLGRHEPSWKKIPDKWRFTSAFIKLFNMIGVIIFPSWKAWDPRKARAESEELWLCRLNGSFPACTLSKYFLTLLYSEWPKLHCVLAFLSVIRLIMQLETEDHRFHLDIHRTL